MKLLKKYPLLKSFGTYTLVNIIAQGIPFFLLPVLTVYLSTEDFGIVTNINSLFLFTAPLVGINISTAISRQYVKKEVDLKVYFSTALRSILMSFALLTLLYTAFASYISEITYIPEYVIYLVTAYALFHNIVESILALWRMEDKALNYGLLRILRTSVEIGISVLLVVGFQYDWFGRFAGMVIGMGFAGIIALIVFASRGFFTRDNNPEYRRHFLKFGLPLIPHTTSGIILLYADKIIITVMLGISENGIYSAAYTIGMVISLIQNSFNQAWVPWLFKKLETNSETEKLKLVKITYAYIAIILVLVLLLWLCTPLIYMIIGKDFAEGSAFVGLIGLGFAFNGMYKMMVNYIFFSERTVVVSYITLVVAAIYISLNIIFINLYKLEGVPIAMTISYFLQFIITWVVCNRIYPMPWLLQKRAN